MSISFKRGRALTTAIAFSAAAALVVSGCTTNGGGDDTEQSGDNGAAGTTVSIATTNALTSLHSGTSEHNLNTNGMVDYLTGNGGLGSFLTISSDLEVVPDTTNGTMELVSEDPLEVKYTLNENAVWSDGTEMTVDDLLLSWVIGSGWFGDGEENYFALAGSTDGLNTTEFPEIDREAKTLTLKYGEAYVDWNLVNLITKPAHVFAAQVDMTAEELTQFFTETEKGTQGDETLQTLGEFHNTGYAITQMPTDESLLVGAGPYVVSDFQANDGGFVQLTPNENWQGEPVAIETIILKFIGDASTQIQQLANGEVNVIEPQADANTLQSLEAQGSTVIQGDQLSYDHLDLTFDGVFADANVREAFLKTIPRQAIVDSIIKPVNPEAEVLNSQIFVSSQAQYAEATAANGYDAFTEPDIEGAKELLAGATPEVKILYNVDNPNRVNAFRLIQQSAEEAGFVIVDEGAPDWGERLGDGSYDASIFGWISPGVGYAGLPQILKTGGGGNYNNYSNEEVDGWINETQTLIDNEERMLELQILIDTATAEDFYGLPLFQSPGLVASDGTVDGLVYNPTQTGVIHNILEWSVVE